MANSYLLYYIYISIFSCININSYSLRTFSENDIKMYREKVLQMFYHAYDNYLKNAFPYDELQPISCRGMDTWGSFSLTLIDALDTLVVMKNYSEFRRVVSTLLSTADFNVNINVSVFETNIRVVGGLLSAHLLSRQAGLDVDPGWPCSGPLLNLAEKVARRLLPAFNTKTGMPYGTVNLKYGVPAGETPITCTAGVSTFIIEFGTLSHLTGDPTFERVAVNALNALWKHRSSLGLVGNHINVQDGKWTALDSGIGGGVDSYFEYLVKGAILFQEPKYMKMFKEYEKLISKYMQKDDWYFWVSMSSGQITMPTFQSLEAFWPGLLTLVGDIEQAVRTLYNYHQIWKQYGFTPEIYDVSHNNAKRENYPLRPELIESVMYLYYATKDPHLLEIGVDILESIEHSAKTDCGYATIKNVMDHKIEDRMESFFLAETTKYLYLLFDPDNFIHNNGSCGEIIQMAGGYCVIGAGGYIFNTEAHPIDIGAVYCCSGKHQDHQLLLYDFQKTMDLHSLLEIRHKQDFFKVFRQKSSFKSKQKKYFQELNKTDSNLFPSDINSTHNVAVSSMNDAHNESEGIEENQWSLTEEEISLVDNFLHEENDVYESNINNQLNPSDSFNKSENISDSSFIENSEVLSNADNEHQQQYLTQEKLEASFESIEVSEELPLPDSTNEIDSTELSADEKAFEEVLTAMYDKNFNDYELLSCPAQPYTSRLNMMGEMFNIY